ncbi:MAG: 4Fe-4S binding protein [Candidatus Alcyoniella australis]|nr:4Fe-4S binding protein [Candidatus Alcyoniella australis]
MGTDKQAPAAAGKPAARAAPRPKNKTKNKKRKPPRIEIREDFCKACGICVEFCPANVLELRQTHVVVVNLAACTKCMMCELRCPDFAIAVFDLDEKKAEA